MQWLEQCPHLQGLKEDRNKERINVKDEVSNHWDP
jgi:hypothetical protein